MFIHLFFLCSNVALQLAEDLHIGESTAYVAPQGPDNIIEKAVKLLQIEYIDSMKLDIENLHQQNERKSEEILKMKQKDRTSTAIIEKMKLDHEAEMTRMKEKYNEEISGIKEEHEKEAIKLKLLILENETKYARKLSAKDTLTQYIMNVLKDSDSLIKFWQHMVKTQAHELSKFEKYHEMEKILIEKQNIIESQSENIKDLEEIIANNNNLTESYEKLEKLDPSKSNCETAPWMTTLTEALASQRKEIKALTGYFEDKKEVEEQMLNVANIIAKTNITITESLDTTRLSKNFEETMDKQSSSLNLLRDILTNSSCGVVYEEDEHRTISANPCSCIPTPPQDTGLQLTNIEYDCKDTKNSSYKIQCQDDQCITYAWPTCSTDIREDDDGSDDLSWTEHNCTEVDIPYMNTSVGCGGSDGWKAKVTTINVGQGVFQKTGPHVPCMDCDEQIFQWTLWRTQGNKLVRTRGVESIPNSFQQQEKGYKLYYEENGAKYYGIPVAEGTTLTEGVVADTCDAVGMRAVCAGDSSCKWSSARCQVMNFETSDCGNPMYGLAKKLCGGNTDPRGCPEMNGLFNYMRDWSGECGVVNGKMCVKGNSYISDELTVYYAYCVLSIQ